MGDFFMRKTRSQGENGDWTRFIKNNGWIRREAACYGVGCSLADASNRRPIALADKTVHRKNETAPFIPIYYQGRLIDWGVEPRQ
jgi:hypothetical protein